MHVLFNKELFIHPFTYVNYYCVIASLVWGIFSSFLQTNGDINLIYLVKKVKVYVLHTCVHLCAYAFVCVCVCVCVRVCVCLQRVKTGVTSAHQIALATLLGVLKDSVMMCLILRVQVVL
jgi:hypothetical protein